MPRSAIVVAASLALALAIAPRRVGGRRREGDPDGARAARARAGHGVHRSASSRGARTMQLAVPPMGGQLQIVKLAETGRRGESRRRRRRIRRGGAGVQPRAGAVRSPARRAGDREGRRAGGGPGGRRRSRAAARAVRRAPRPSSTCRATSWSSAIKAQQNVLTARGGEAAARAARGRREDASRHRPRLGRRPAREAQQGAARRCRSPSATSTAFASARRSTASSPSAPTSWRSAASGFPGVDARFASATRRSPASRSPT